MENENTIKTFPVLYGIDSRGDVKVWEIAVVEEPSTGFHIVRVTHGKLDGKQQVNDVTIRKGKNIGKANETSIREQAISEAESKFSKQLDKNYRETIEEAKNDVPLLPMLAHPFEKRANKIEYPCFVQPKLDGVRCLATKVSETEIVYTSRNAKKFNTIPHLSDYLLKVMSVGEIYDGELYAHGMTFQEIISIIKRESSAHPDAHKLEYHVYDIADDGMDFAERHNHLLRSQLTLADKPVKMVLTEEANNEADIKHYHMSFMEDGYEGTMIRNKSGGYTFEKRSTNLQKYKDFDDGEFKIIGAREGIGSHEGQAILICEMENSKTFSVRCRGTDEYRKDQYENFENYYGKMLTVRYQGLSESDIPRFPVGIAIRDYE